MWVMTFCGAFGFALAAGLEMIWVKKHIFSMAGESVLSEAGTNYAIRTPE
jgi:hypothetical protein